MGLGVLSFADALSGFPDLLLLLEDRYEVFAAASAAMVSCIPIAHLHGGEVTAGAIDEAIRHSITKMSHLHFVASPEYRRRVLQLGESPSSVFCVGGLGVDNILSLDLLPRDDLERQLDFKFLKRNNLVTFHPETLEYNDSSANHVDQLLLALESLNSTGIIFTMPNADTSGRAIIRRINDFCCRYPTAKSFMSLGQLRYFSCVKQVDCVVGILQVVFLVPSFKKAKLTLVHVRMAVLSPRVLLTAYPNAMQF